MKFSEQWLREWVDPDIDTGTLADRLTMAGLEVDAVSPVAPAFSDVVVGRVVRVDVHPDADRLRVCEVDVGTDPLTIVCGAPNVAPGMHVPTALVGATLPDGMKIKRAKLRGVESTGMLCSAKELGIGEGAEGLMALPDDTTPGADLRRVLGLDDVTIELGLTPNRGDCLGIAGLARETGVLTGAEVAGPPIAPVAAVHDDTLPIELLAPEACPRYLGRIIHDVDPTARTPLWLKERLRRCGVRSLGPVIDVTNYVLLELGQPMHAFDLACITGGIRVRQAAAGERLTLLDGSEHELAADMLVIADHQRPLAMAGIMGGQESAVGDATHSLFLESAFFAPQAITGRARRAGLHTDSSHRFERGVDFEMPRRAMERATALILEIAGGRAGPVIEAVEPTRLPQRQPITLRARRISRLLGHELEAVRIREILERLGMAVEPGADASWQVLPPSFRFDLAIEADLIEEIARVHGYDRMPTSHPRAALRLRAPDAKGDRVSDARRLLAARGYHEAITYSFIDADSQRLFDPDLEALKLANPISAETAVMRTSLWPGLVRACEYNLNRQQGRVFLFEYGSNYIKYNNEIKEENWISGLACGALEQEQWGVQAREVDFHDVKADVEALLIEVGGRREYRFVPAGHPALHPVQSARIEDADGQEIGWIGALNPRLRDQLEIDHHVIVFAISVDRLDTPPLPRFHELSRFPVVRRDLALIVDEAVPAADLMSALREAAGETLTRLSLFDIYRGKGVDSGKKSVALGLTLQNFSRTLTDGESEVLVADILRHLQDKFGATLRE